jgi:outer membrane protein OmpA-like peptidoglycan-associated protein
MAAKRFLIVLLAALCCSSVFGQEKKYDNKWFGGAGGGFNFGLDKYNPSDRSNSGLGVGTAIDAWVGKRFNDWIGVAVGYHGLNTSKRFVDYGEFPLHYFHADAILMRSRYIMPYLHAGVVSLDKVSPAGGIGVKVPIPISDVVSIVPDINVTAFSGRAFSSSRNVVANVGASLGLAFNLSRSHKKKVVEQPYVAPAPQPVVVPEPEPEIVPEPVPEPEPEPVTLAKKSEEFTAKIAGVTLFDHDHSDLRAESFPVLDEIAAWLLDNPERTALIEGYTDKTGSDTYNLTLSQRRADSVRDYLAGKGVDKERLTAIGRGKGNFTEGNNEVEIRQQNRRVVITLK